MDYLPDHLRARIINSTGAVDWMTEEWMRRAAPSANSETDDAHRHAGALSALRSAALRFFTDRIFRWSTGTSTSPV